MERKKKHVFLCTTILKSLRRLRKFFGARVCDPQQTAPAETLWNVPKPLCAPALIFRVL
jgi:hypothetical protein